MEGKGKWNSTRLHGLLAHQMLSFGETWSLGSVWCEMSFSERHVTFVADERDAIQKKTFTKWVNKHLNKVSDDIIKIILFFL